MRGVVRGVEVRESLSGLDPRPDRSDLVPQRSDIALDTAITVSRAPARASRALSRRFRGCFALQPAPLRVHRPTRASGGGAEGVERIEVRESLVE